MSPASSTSAKAKPATAVVSSREAGVLVTQSAVTIAVDTAYVASQTGGQISQGIYMFDNRLTNGSTGEGSLELHSVVNASDKIGFEIVPINPNLGDTVTITGFQVSQGTVFGSNGYPIEPDPTNGSYWVGQAVNANPTVTIYQIQGEIVSGGLRPTRYIFQWDPYITIS